MPVMYIQGGVLKAVKLVISSELAPEQLKVPKSWKLVPVTVWIGCKLGILAPLDAAWKGDTTDRA